MYGYQDIFAEFVEETIFADIVDETIEATIVEETILADIVDETLLLEIMETEELQVDLSAEEIIVEVESWSCPQISGGGGGHIFITNITTSGIAANHEYEPDTVPADSVLTSVTVDSNDCTVHFIAEGGVGYSPRVEIDGVFCSNLQEVSQDKRLFTGSIPVTISETTNITIRSSTNQRDSAVIIRASAAPEILSCSIGDYPGTQTAAKQSDLIHVTGVVEESATHVRLMGYGAFQDSGWVPCSGGTFDITGTIGSASGTYGARVYTKNAMGSESGSFDSSNQILLDQDSPVFIDLETTFPNGQSALKGTEMAIQGTRVLDFTSVIYSSPHGDISVVNPILYEENKTIQCMNPGDYNDSFNNFKIEACKSSNDTSNIFQKNIEVADIAPVVTVSQPLARLRSSPSGQNYTIAVLCNQNLMSAPDINIPISGTWQGVEFTGSLKNWTRIISIIDGDLPGQDDWTFNIVPTNRAGIVASSISGVQNVGGFISREITLSAFANEVSFNVAVSDYSKCTLTWEIKNLPNKRGFNTTNTPDTNSWCMAGTLNNSPTTVRILDTAASGNSSSNTILTVEENM